MIAAFFWRKLRRGVTRVRCKLLRRPGEALVQLAEAAEREVDLAAHLDHSGGASPVEAQRDRLDRADVARYVLSLDAVAARRATREHAVLVREVDGEPVDLRLEEIGDGLVCCEPLADIGVPFPHRLVGRDLLERAHRLEVPHLLETVRQPAHPERGRVGSDELRVRLLERDELVVEGVVCRVLHDRRVIDVVGDERAAEDLAQLGGALLRGCQGAPRPVRRSRPAPPPRDAPVVDPPPRDSDGVHPGCLRSADVEGRVADVGRIGGIGSKRSAPSRSGSGIRLVALRLVAADNRLEEMAERDDGERELSRVPPLGRHDAESPAFRVQPLEYVSHSDARLELVVERDVVRAVNVHELRRAVGIDRHHLRFKPRPADRLHQLGIRVLAPEHLTRGVTHRREDDRAGVDDRAVEVEEDGRKSHCG